MQRTKKHAMRPSVYANMNDYTKNIQAKKSLSITKQI